MSYFIYKGISSQKFGILERCPIPPQAEEQYEAVTIPGRAETVMRPKKHRPDMTISFVLGIKDIRKLRECYSWLTGTGDLILSRNVSEKYRVKKIKTSPEYISRRFAKINITMTLSPFVYSVAEIPIDVTGYTAETVIMNDGNCAARPYIEFVLEKDENAILMGDVDLDGRVTAQDAVMLQIAATSDDFSGWSEKQLAAADMNGDGLLDANDVALILRRAAESGSFGEPETPYDVYFHINGRTMRVSVPEECSIQQLPVTIDSENEIAYYTNESGEKVNVLDRTYGDLPYLDAGGNTFRYTSNIPLRYMTIRKNERR